MLTGSPDRTRASGVGSSSVFDGRFEPIALVLLVVLLPLASVRVVWHSPGGLDDWTRRVMVAPFDLAGAVLALLVAGRLLHERRPVRLGALGWSVLALGGWLVVSLVVHGSPLGVNELLRYLGAAAIVSALIRIRPDRSSRRLVLAVIVVVGVLEAVLAAVQSARGRAFGRLPVDFAGPLYPFGTSFAGRGGLDHPYHLVFVLLVAQAAALVALRDADDRRPWLAALALIGVGIAVTYCRAAVAGELVAGVVALIAWRKAGAKLLVVGMLAAALGLGVGAVSFGTGWWARSQSSVGSSADSGRGTRLHEAAKLTRSQPVFGVGPGRYVVALDAVQHRSTGLPSHDVIAQEAAEGGVPAALAALVVLVLFVRWAFRNGAWTLAVTALGLPMFLLDAYPYVFATGIATSGLWLGVAALGRTTRPRTAA